MLGRLVPTRRQRNTKMRKELWISCANWEYREWEPPFCELFVHQNWNLLHPVSLIPHTHTQNVSNFSETFSHCRWPWKLNIHLNMGERKGRAVHLCCKRNGSHHKEFWKPWLFLLQNWTILIKQIIKFTLF